jgi:hypothetical protein
LKKTAGSLPGFALVERPVRHILIRGAYTGYINEVDPEDVEFSNFYGETILVKGLNILEKVLITTGVQYMIKDNLTGSWKI